MSRGKGKTIGCMNERDFPHVVELAVPPGGFQGRDLEFDAFHRERNIPIRCGSARLDGQQFYIRFCFPHSALADAFAELCGGRRLTHIPRTRGTRVSNGN
jgi:hypothetical protein